MHHIIIRNIACSLVDWQNYVPTRRAARVCYLTRYSSVLCNNLTYLQ